MSAGTIPASSPPTPPLAATGAPSPAPPSSCCADSAARAVSADSAPLPPLPRGPHSPAAPPGPSPRRGDMVCEPLLSAGTAAASGPPPAPPCPAASFAASCCSRGLVLAGRPRASGSRPPPRPACVAGDCSSASAAISGDEPPACAGAGAGDGAAAAAALDAISASTALHRCSSWSRRWGAELASSWARSMQPRLGMRPPRCSMPCRRTSCASCCSSLGCWPPAPAPAPAPPAPPPPAPGQPAGGAAAAAAGGGGGAAAMSCGSWAAAAPAPAPAAGCCCRRDSRAATIWAATAPPAVSGTRRDTAPAMVASPAGGAGAGALTPASCPCRGAPVGSPPSATPLSAARSRP
jgi:hypothetical protein